MLVMDKHTTLVIFIYQNKKLRLTLLLSISMVVLGLAIVERALPIWVQ